MDDNPRWKASEITEKSNPVPELGYYGRKAEMKPLLQPVSIKWEKIGSVRSQKFWDAVIFSDEFRFSVFHDSGQEWV